MNKQFDVFVKMKITEMSKTIHDMTYTYINPETKKPTDVPAKHYQDILKQPVEVMVEEQVKRQFLNVMFKQLKNLKEEEPHLFYQSLLLMDIGKSPDSLAVNEEVALKMTADYMVNGVIWLGLRPSGVPCGAGVADMRPKGWISL